MNLDLLSGEVEEYREARQFWLDTLAGKEEVEVLVPDRPSELRKQGLFSERRLSLPITLSLIEGLLNWSSRKDSLIYVILLSGTMTALAKIRSSRSVIVGCPAIAGPNEESAVNSFLPTSLQLDGSQTMKQLWKDLNRTVTAAYGYQYFPVNQLFQGEQEQKWDFSQLCNVACELVPMHDPSKLQNCRMSAGNGVTFSFKRIDEEITGELIYNGELYSEGMMQALADSVLHILEQMVGNPEMQVQALSLVNEKVRTQLLTEFHSNKGEFPSDKTISQLFEEQALLKPERTALVCGTRSLSYRGLNERAEVYAEQLKKNGIQRGHIVGVVCDRTMDMVISMIAVLKAGSAYLPIDPDYPQKRIQYMLADSGAACLISPAKYVSRFPFSGYTLLIQGDQLLPVHASANSENQVEKGASAGGEDIAYVIYTSGSTGSPKGVMVGHRGMANLHSFFRNELGIRETDKIVQFASASFDASIWEIFMALFTGAELHLLTKETIESYDDFTDYVQQSAITVATLPPAYAAHLDPSQMPTLRILVTAGSASNPDLAARWEKHLNYINAYGPTESTICATYWQTGEKLKREDDSTLTIAAKVVKVPIGKPVLNSEIYIINHEHHLIPIGFMGELCIGGVSLALGYLGREEMTAERFIENPFVPGELMYKTGDYGRWLPDGNIEFLGRMDDQVKIRGFRIETGEIEVQLMQHPEISEVFVKVQNNQSDQNDEKALCAYFAASKTLGAEQLQEWLGSRLPAYMLPQHYVQMSELPLTANGKIDTKSLPDPSLSSHAGIDVADNPNATVTESRLAELWKSTLGIDHVNLNDHYFIRGGHSLKAAMLVTEIHKHFHIQLSLRKIMEVPVFQDMAVEIDRSLKSGALPAIRPAEHRDFYPLSLAQKRLFILNQYDPMQLTYNIPVFLQINGPVQVDRLQSAMNRLVRRHETLRTAFMLHEGKPVQYIHEEEELSLQLGCRTIQESNLITEVRTFIQPFDLAQAPLLRSQLLCIGETHHVLCLDMHHMISDGVSMSVLIDDLLAFYQDETVEPLRLQYKDYACWQNEMLETGQLAEQEAFWLNEFAVPAPLLQIPTDYPRQANTEGEDEAVKAVLSPDVVESLHTLASNTGSTLYMVLLSAYSLLLSIYSGQKDIVVGTPVAGRSRADLQPLIGMFVNIIPLRSLPENQKTFIDFLVEVKETALSAFENQDYPFDELIRKLNVSRDAGRNPLFDASFALQNMDTAIPEIEGLNIKPLDLVFYRAKFDLTLWGEEAGEEILLALEYRTSLFKRRTVEKMLHDFIRIIDLIIEQPHRPLGQFDLRTTEEIEGQRRRYTELEALLEMDFDL